MIQHTDAFGRISYPGFARAVRTWIYGALFLNVLVSGSFFLGVWVLLVDTEHWILWEMTLAVVQCLVRQWIRSLRQSWLLDELDMFCGCWLGEPEVFGLHSYAEWRRVLNQYFSFGLGCAARTRKS